MLRPAGMRVLEPVGPRRRGGVAEYIASPAGTRELVTRLGATVAGALDDLEAGRDRRAVRRLASGLAAYQAWARARSVVGV